MMINRIVRTGVQPASAILNRKDPSTKRDPRGQPYPGYKRKAFGNDGQPVTAKKKESKRSNTLELSEEATP